MTTNSAPCLGETWINFTDWALSADCLALWGVCYLRAKLTFKQHFYLHTEANVDMPIRLNRPEIDAQIKQLDGWYLETDNANIRKAWAFVSFQTAMRFLSKVGELAECHDHHPEFLSTYTNVRIRLTTHDAQGLTHKDFELAIAIDQLVKNEFLDLLKTK